MSKLSNLLNVEEGQPFKVNIKGFYYSFKVEGERMFYYDEGFGEWFTVARELLCMTIIFSHPELLITDESKCKVEGD